MAGIPSDTFFVIHNRDGTSGAEVKPAVLKSWEQTSTHAFFQALLNLIRRDMLVINHSVDNNPDGCAEQQTRPEEQALTSPERAMRNTLPIPDRSSARRKSLGDIFQALHQCLR
ncbi:hypothetical protein OPT61_g2602 [Boeremia exigua]|uniref:Uncharacterized protein n=1 Tax=Boeremia exigua TaxID=749465 RepID=A0ACC2IKW4_9PLEO|nr:hypothetical protein OPT61_g2602 [Boeremia exigua]